jgi:hypothetical protein
MDLQDIIEDLIETEISATDPRLAHIRRIEPAFEEVCKRNQLYDYREDIAEYVTNEEGRMRADVTPGAFGLRFALNDEDAAVVLEYVSVFFSFFNTVHQ